MTDRTEYTTGEADAWRAARDSACAVLLELAQAAHEDGLPESAATLRRAAETVRAMQVGEKQ